MKLNKWLTAAGIYNILWGGFVIFFPNMLFQIGNMDVPLYPMIWQSVGMIVGVYGVGYLIAASNIYQHWPIVLVGFLGKIFGPIGFLFHVLSGSLPLIAGLVIIFNDLIWWIPFYLILRKAWLKAKS
jgi:small multidrug resistance pump